jgi:small GTP-binding protein
VLINFFDLSGNDEYKLIRTEFYKHTSGVIMVFDVDNRDSYISLVHWEEEMKRSGIEINRVKVIVCANKCESKSREVKEAEAAKWAKNRNFEYFETSANDGKNIV